MTLALAVGLLVGGGVYLMMRRDMLRIAMGFTLLSHGVNLMLISAGGTAWHALTEGSANARGLAMALRLLCRQMDINAQVVSGTRDGEPHFWNAVSVDGEWICFDLSRGSSAPSTWEELTQRGYDWSEDPVFGEI